MIDTTSSLLSELRSRSILRRDQLEEIETSLAQLLHNPQALARELVSRGWLTPYQVNQLFSGRAANLTLGPYVLLERVGAGELGLIFKARHRHLNRVSAVHVVREELLAQPEAVSRFYEEVQAASHLDHANVVHLYDAGPVGRTHFLAMEHVTGTDLRQLVQQKGPLPIEMACDFIRQTALGLEHGFERGLMHHALKPSFLLVTAKSEESSAGMIKIANLGVTHLLNTTEKSQASFAGPGVSVDFISPEQADDPRVLDVRSELYSLGCVFYFLLTGQAPFLGGSPVDRLNRHMREPAPNPQRLRPDTPPAVAEMVRCLLAKRVEERYARPRDVAQGLAAFSQASGTSGSFTVTPTASTSAETRVLRSGSPALTATPVDIPNLTARPVVPKFKRWKLLVAAAGACMFLGIVLLTVIGVGIARWRARPVGKPPAPTIDSEVASTAFRDLEVRAREGRDLDRVRDDLLAFRIANPTSAEALPAAELAARLPAPLDRLSADSIPKEERFDWQPRELVEVLGEHQPKGWMTERLLTVQPVAGLVVTAAPDNTIRVWDLTTRAPRASLPPRINLTCAALSPDGKRLALGGYDRFVRVFDVGAGTERWSSDASKFGYQFMAFSPDGELVAAAAQDRTIRLFEAGTGKERASWIAHTSGMRALAFTPDGKTLVTSGYRLDAVVPRRGALPEIRTWDVTNGAVKNTIDLPMAHHVTSMLFPAAANSLATVGTDSVVRFWDVTTGKEGTPVQATTGGIAQAALVPGGKLATVGGDFAIRLWTLADGALQATLTGHTTSIFYFAVAADGRTATTASYDQTVRSWDLVSGTEIGVISGAAGWVTHAIASPDGHTLATGHRNGAIKVWDAGTGHVRLTLPGHALAVTALAYSADGRTLASASYDLRVKLWDVDDGKEKASRDMPATIIDLNFAGERRGALAGITSDQLYVWTNQLQETARPVPHEHNKGRAVAFAVDGKSVFTTGDDGNLRRWELPTLQMKGFQQAHRTGVRALAMGPDGRSLATVASGEAPIRLWAIVGGDIRERRLLPGHTQPPVALAFTSDGKTLASVAENGQILLWDVAGGRKTRDWLITGGPARSVSFSPDGRHLLALNGKGVCHILRLGLPPRQRTDTR